MNNLSNLKESIWHLSVSGVEDRDQLNMITEIQMTEFCLLDKDQSSGENKHLIAFNIWNDKMCKASKTF